MRELLAITDVTHMWEDVVCIAGVTQDFRCIRPVTDGGVRIWSLYKSRKPIIYPGSKVWMDFSEAEITPPPPPPPAHRGPDVRSPVGRG